MLQLNLAVADKVAVKAIPWFKQILKVFVSGLGPAQWTYSQSAVGQSASINVRLLLIFSSSRFLQGSWVQVGAAQADYMD